MESRADTLAHRFYTAHSDGAFLKANPEEHTQYGLTSLADKPPGDDEYSFTTVQNPNKQWKFKFEVTKTFEQFFKGESGGAAASTYPLGQIKILPAAPNESPYKIVPDPGFADPGNGVHYGRYQVVRAAMDSTFNGPKTEWAGPHADEDGYRGDPVITKGNTYTAFVTITPEAAAAIKHGEGEHLADMEHAYKLLYNGFGNAVDSIKAQNTEAELWKTLYNTLRDEKNFLRGVCPSPDQYNDIAAWKQQLKTFFTELADMSDARDKGKEARHSPTKMLVVWADGVPWEGEVEVRDESFMKMVAKANTAAIYLTGWNESVLTTPDVINPKQALLRTTQAGAKRVLPAIK